MINKVVVTVDRNAEVAYDDKTETPDPEISIRLSNGSLIELFGQEEDLIWLAEEIQRKVKERVTIPDRKFKDWTPDED